MVQKPNVILGPDLTYVLSFLSTSGLSCSLSTWQATTDTVSCAQASLHSSGRHAIDPGLIKQHIVDSFETST